MITVKNNSKSAIGLHGREIAPGESIQIPEAEINGSRIIATWLEKGFLVVVEPEYIEAQAINEKEPRQIPANAAAQAEQDEKDRLIKALGEIGIERDRRYSVETLRDLLKNSEQDQ